MVLGVNLYNSRAERFRSFPGIFSSSSPSFDHWMIPHLGRWFGVEVD